MVSSWMTYLPLIVDPNISGRSKIKLNAIWQAVSKSGNENQLSAHLFVRLRTEFRVR